MIDGTYIQSYNEKDRLVNELPEFSTKFPDVTFIYLWTDCQGGDCYYDGFACRNGKIIIDNRGKGADFYSRSFELDKLQAVVEKLGVNVSGNFEPFERGFFNDEKNIIYPVK